MTSTGLDDGNASRDEAWHVLKLSRRFPITFLDFVVTSTTRIGGQELSTSGSEPLMTLLHLKQGWGRLFQYSRQFILSPGDVVWIPGVWPHRLELAVGCDCTMLSFPLWWFIEENPARTELALGRSIISSDAAFSAALHAAIDAVRTVGADRNEAACGLFRDVLVRNLEITPNDAGNDTHKRGGRMMQILMHVSGNYQNSDLNPRSAAKAIKCSVRTLHKTCAENNTTFLSLVVDSRLYLASYMLVTTTKSVSEIAYDCGFDQVSHFCRLFKQAKGMTALAFRTSMYPGKNLGIVDKWYPQFD